MSSAIASYAAALKATSANAPITNNASSVGTNDCEKSIFQTYHAKSVIAVWLNLLIHNELVEEGF